MNVKPAEKIIEYKGIKLHATMRSSGVSGCQRPSLWLVVVCNNTVKEIVLTPPWPDGGYTTVDEALEAAIDYGVSTFDHAIDEKSVSKELN